MATNGAQRLMIVTIWATGGVLAETPRIPGEQAVAWVPRLPGAAATLLGRCAKDVAYDRPARNSDDAAAIATAAEG